jgi:hypothetical protein
MLKQVSGWRWGSALSGVFRWATGIHSFMVRDSANLAAVVCAGVTVKG